MSSAEDWRLRKEGLLEGNDSQDEDIIFSQSILVRCNCETWGVTKWRPIPSHPAFGWRILWVNAHFRPFCGHYEAFLAEDYKTLLYLQGHAVKIPSLLISEEFKFAVFKYGFPSCLAKPHMPQCFHTCTCTCRPDWISLLENMFEIPTLDILER